MVLYPWPLLIQAVFAFWYSNTAKAGRYACNLPAFAFIYQTVTIRNRLITFLYKPVFQHFPVVSRMFSIWLFRQRTAHIHNGEIPFFSLSSHMVRTFFSSNSWRDSFFVIFFFLFHYLVANQYDPSLEGLRPQLQATLQFLSDCLSLADKYSYTI